ncbi:sigma factor-like helix-turn-helix DNA-binding protein [Levilactobacillus paucivorans]|uniref:sigma factor-like helix-turn-helix DNA-binding protein n=1 Tax=Levilactobacillus paucivorans TaxID=616990 RepID=UPI0009FA23C1
MRCLLILRCDQGLSIKEISARLGRRPETVKMRLRRVPSVTAIHGIRFSLINKKH